MSDIANYLARSAKRSIALECAELYGEHFRPSGT